MRVIGTPGDETYSAELVITCEACGESGNWSNRWRFVRVELAPGQVVTICRNRGRGGIVPKGSCAQQVAHKVKACPGCGKPDTWGYGPRLCHDCVTVLARGRELTPAERVEWRAVELDKLVPWLDCARADRDRLEVELAEVLARLARTRCKRHGDHWEAEFTTDQAAAARQLGHHLAELVHLSRLAGFADGTDLLGQMASGELGAIAFHERHRRTREGLERQLDRLRQRRADGVS